MFKFAKYFLLVLIITTIFPLVSLFLWTNHQMEKRDHKEQQHFSSIGKKQAINSLEQYTKICESSILEKIQNLPDSEFSPEGLAKALQGNKIELLSNVFVYDI